MPPKQILYPLYLYHFSSPKNDRIIYQTLRSLRARRIIEVGIGRCDRALRLIRLAQAINNARDVEYTGIDLFEDNGDLPSTVTLKYAFRCLRRSGARIRLLPGTVDAVFQQISNSLQNIELVIFSPNWEPLPRSPAWFYLPRMLNANARVFLSGTSDGQPSRCLDVSQVAELTRRDTRRAA